jgi:hypothetical protein
MSSARHVAHGNPVPVARASGGTLDLPLAVTYQGCADKGLCYPPITKTFTVRLAGGAGASGGQPGGAFGNGIFFQGTNTLTLQANPGQTLIDGDAIALAADASDIAANQSAVEQACGPDTIRAVGCPHPYHHGPMPDGTCPLGRS